MRKKAAREIAVEPSMLPRCGGQGWLFSAVSRPERTGVPNSSSSVGKPGEVFVIGALPESSRGLRNLVDHGPLDACSGLSVLAPPYHCAPTLSAVSPFRSSRGTSAEAPV